MTTTLTSLPAAATLPKPNGDFYQLTESLTDGDGAVLQKVRAFMETSVAPIINKYCAKVPLPVTKSRKSKHTESKICVVRSSRANAKTSEGI